MRTGQVAAGRGPRRLVSACLVGATGLGFLAFTLSAGADVLTVSGSAYGASGTVTVDDLDPGTEPTPSVLEQTPTVTLPPGGGSVTATAGSISFGPGGGYLSTGPSEVKTEGTTGPSGGSTSTASVSTVDAMGYLTTSQLSSTCVATETGLTAWTVLSPDAMLVLDASTTTALPAEPAPQTEYRGVSNGDSYTVILNEQSYDPISITVTAVHIILEGPTTVGHLYLGQSRCAIVPVEATTTTTPWESTSSTSTSTTEPTTTSSTSTSTSTSSSTTTTVVPATTCARGQGPGRRPLPPAAASPADPRCPDARG